MFSVKTYKMPQSLILLLSIVAIFSSILWTGGLYANHKEVASECLTSRFPILLYHHIRPYNGITDPAAHNLSVSQAEFEEQMKYFSKKWWVSITTKSIQDTYVPCNAFMVTFDDGYYDVYKYALPIMEKYWYQGVVSLIAARIDESDYLSGNQIREMQKQGWEIASHSWHHSILTRTPIKELSYEIKKSKSDLEKWFTEDVETFVYPGGFYGPLTLEEVKKAGYRHALSTRFGYANLSWNPLELKRINIPPGSGTEELKTLLETAQQKN